jgi:hypothetical protein
MKQEKLIVEDGKIKKVKVKIKKPLNYYEIIERSLYIITSILFILFFNNFIDYKYFVWFLILSFLFSIFSNRIILNFLNKSEEKTSKNNKKDDKIKKEIIIKK